MKNIQKVLIVISVSIAITGLYFGFQLSTVMNENTHKAVEKEKMIIARGVKTTAKVIKYDFTLDKNYRRTVDDNGKQRYEIDYQFEADSKKYSGKAYHVGRENPNEPIEIIYDSQNPENNRWINQEPPIEEYNFITLFMIVLPCLIAWGLYNVVRKFLDSRGWL
ncbi:MAG: hypothetical protein K1X72_15500 [Pyrinomonadaceae bacterium]|nr:hypothetical protein [Pyrinomonadaceae bacterium]